MKYRQLGKSGLKVSEISLGGWLTFSHFAGHKGWAISSIHPRPMAFSRGSTKRGKLLPKEAGLAGRGNLNRRI